MRIYDDNDISFINGQSQKTKKIIKKQIKVGIDTKAKNRTMLNKLIRVGEKSLLPNTTLAVTESNCCSQNIRVFLHSI